MKKVACILIAVVMICSLAACNNTPVTSESPASTSGSSAPSAQESPASTAPSSPASPSSPAASSGTSSTPDLPPPVQNVKVGISLAMADDFTENMRRLYEGMAGGYGIDIVSISNAAGDASTQIANVEALIAVKPDVIILRAVDAEVGDTLVEMIHSAGVPVVVDETKPSTSRDYDANVAGNQYVHGHLIGEHLDAYLKEHTDVTLNMLYINGGTSDNIRRRMNGILDIVGNNSRFNLIGDELGSWSASTAQEITEAYLTSHPEMNLIACANDEMALGVIETLKAAGKLKDIMVFGVDGTESGQRAVKAGELTGTTLNDVTISVNIIYDLCLKLAAGEDVSGMFSNPADKEIDPKAYILLTAANIGADGTFN